MASVTVTTADRGDVDGFVASMIGLFREDGGAHGAATNPDWPVQERMAQYSGLLSDGTCLLAVARDGHRVVGQPQPPRLPRHRPHPGRCAGRRRG